MDAVVWLVLAASALGVLLFATLSALALTARYAETSRPLLRRGLLGGLIGAGLAFAGFTLVPQLALPGPGTLAVSLAIGSATLTLAVAGTLLLRTSRRSPLPPRDPAAQKGLAADVELLLRHPIARTLSGLAAIVLAGRGVAGIREGEARGGAAALVLAVVLLLWALTARIPSWFRR
jgi:hypothetical protein